MQGVVRGFAPFITGSVHLLQKVGYAGRYLIGGCRNLWSALVGNITETIQLCTQPGSKVSGNISRALTSFRQRWLYLAFNRAGHIPVSYTHLTLPTILRV